jgi:hypothetical protein
MLGMGLTAPMSALVLALLIEAAKTSHETQSSESDPASRRFHTA